MLKNAAGLKSKNCDHIYMLPIKAFKNYLTPAFVNKGVPQQSFHTNALLRNKDFTNAKLHIATAPDANLALLPYVHLEPIPSAEKALQDFELDGEAVHNQTVMSAMRETLHSKDARAKGKVFHHLVSSIADESLSMTTRVELAHILKVFNDIKAFNRLDLRGLDFRGRDLSGLELSNSNLHDALLSNANCSHTILTGADMTHVVAIFTNFTNATMNDAKLDHAEMPHACFEGAKLVNAKLFGVILSLANLRDADLAGAILNDADMTRVNITNANVDGAKFLGASLDNVNLKAAKNFRHAILIENVVQFSTSWSVE